MTSSEKSSKTRELTSDKIFSDTTFIHQHKNGYRFNSDSMILSWFIYKILKNKKIMTAIEVGSGSGVIPIVLSRRGLSVKTFCVEKQNSLFALLEKNILNNGLKEHLEPVEGSFTELSLPLKSKYDLIYTNPPYFPLNTGRPSPSNEKANAKHEFSGSLNDFLLKSVKYLRKQGHFIFVYPVSRIQYALACASNAGFSLKDLYFYRENSSVSPSVFTANLIYGGSNSTAFTELITLRDKNGQFTAVGKEIMYDKN